MIMATECHRLLREAGVGFRMVGGRFRYIGAVPDHLRGYEPEFTLWLSMPLSSARKAEIRQDQRDRERRREAAEIAKVAELLQRLAKARLS